MISTNKPLRVFQSEWNQCSKCSLGERRLTAGESIIHGSGAMGQIMIVLEAPTWVEEKAGFPAQGDGGTFLLAVLKQLKLEDSVYITYSVLCRSCRVDTDNATGLPRTRRGPGGHMVPAYRDNAPTGDQLNACKQRLHEEVYIVDPVVIVACGAVAVSAMVGKATTLASIRGEPMHVSVEGAGRAASITEKKHSWSRTLRGETSWPTIPSAVRYLMVPTHDPLFVYRQYSDKRTNSPGDQFTKDLTTAAEILQMYREVASVGAATANSTEPDVEDEEDD